MSSLQWLEMSYQFNSVVLNCTLAILLLNGLFGDLLCNTAQSQETAKIDFAHDVFPILKSRCASCHSNGVYKGGLSLESREQLLDSGSVELHASGESDLLDRILSDDPDYRMPPDGERLGRIEIEKFKAWIDQGLPWPSGVSLKSRTWQRPLSLRKIELPDLRGVNPIDRFLSCYFETKGIADQISAQKPLTDHQFLRRAKLDLLGELPTIAELRTFAKNAEPNKREALVKELLARDQDYADH